MHNLPKNVNEGLNPDKASPDHATFSRFHNIISKEAMIELKRLVLNRFAKKGLIINEDIAVLWP